jgi:hypothetical protein
MNQVRDLTMVDVPPHFYEMLEDELAPNPTLAVVAYGLPTPRSASQLLREVFTGPLSDELQRHGVQPIFCAPDQTVLSGTRFGGILLMGDSPDDVVPVLVRLRAQSSTLMTPILVALREGAPPAHRLLAHTWRCYADAVLEGQAGIARTGAALVRLREIDSRRWLMQPFDDRMPAAARRRIDVLRFLVTRDMGSLDPVRDPSSPAAYSYPPLDLGGALDADLESLAQDGLLEKVPVDIVSTCAACADARLLFRYEVVHGLTRARCLQCGQLSLAHELRERVVYRWVLTTDGAEGAWHSEIVPRR